MSVNTMNFEQCAIILNDLHKQATGQEQSVAVDTGNFTSIGTTLLQNGRDPLMNAISQTLGYTLMVDRPYRRKFTDMEATQERFGGITRKFQVVDKDWEDSASYNLTDGDNPTPDMFAVNKPEVIQTNFYGRNIRKRHYTVFRQQLDVALKDASEFGRFWSMISQNNRDVMEQTIETIDRATLANFIGGKVAADNGVIHLLSEYNADTDQNLTLAQAKAPANFDAFVKWIYARVQNLSDLMKERSGLFQIQLEGKTIMHHTPAEYQHIYINSQYLTEMTDRVLADTYHDSFLKYGQTASMTYWQTIEDPFSINVAPSYLNAADGTIINGEAIKVENIFGVMFDRDALGTIMYDNFASATPLENSGDYYNLWFNFEMRWWNDFSEKGIVLLLD